MLEEFSYLDDHYLMASDGTGFFESNHVHSDNCCIKQRNGIKIKVEVALSDKLSDYEPNTYILVKQIFHPWELYYLDFNRKISTLSIEPISGLSDILQDKRWKSVSPADKTKAKELISAYHAVCDPDKKVSYCHPMLCAAIVYPDKRFVLPFAPELIMKTDGSKKNDCERNAAKRLCADM